jgi:hypothetical protein
MAAQLVKAMRKKKIRIPAQSEILEFMRRESRPYKFELTEELEPLRVNIENKTIYINKDILLNEVKRMVEAGINWRGIWRKNFQHEKAHEKYSEWKSKLASSATEYGWLLNYLVDLVIDKIHFKDNSRYRKWLLIDARYAYETMKKNLSREFPNFETRPQFFYNQAAYWIAIGAVTLEEAIELYPEKANYIAELAQLFRKIKSEQDLEWAFIGAKNLFLKHFL